MQETARLRAAMRATHGQGWLDDPDFARVNELDQRRHGARSDTSLLPEDPAQTAGQPAPPCIHKARQSAVAANGLV